MLNNFPAERLGIETPFINQPAIFRGNRSVRAAISHPLAPHSHCLARRPMIGSLAGTVSEQVASTAIYTAANSNVKPKEELTLDIKLQNGEAVTLTKQFKAKAKSGAKTSSRRSSSRRRPRSSKQSANDRAKVLKNKLRTGRLFLIRASFLLNRFVRNKRAALAKFR
jgi:hypothetical protein